MKKIPSVCDVDCTSEALRKAPGRDHVCLSPEFVCTEGLSLADLSVPVVSGIGQMKNIPAVCVVDASSAAVAKATEPTCVSRLPESRCIEGLLVTEASALEARGNDGKVQDMSAVGVKNRITGSVSIDIVDAFDVSIPQGYAYPLTNCDLESMFSDSENCFDVDVVPDSVSEDEADDHIPDFSPLLSNRNDDTSSVVSMPFTSTGEVSNVDVDEKSGNVSDSTKTQTSRTYAKKKIPRPCLYCGKMETNLNRHLNDKHSEEDGVKRALKLPFRDKCAAIANLRKEGILKYNKDQMKEVNPSYLRERGGTADDSLVVCNLCSGFYSKKYFARHSKTCQADRSSRPQALPVKYLRGQNDDTLSNDYKVKILARFSSDEAGETCRTDAAIVMYGSRQFEKIFGKKDKAVEIKKSVMTDMRRLATLFLTFKNLCGKNGRVVETSSDMLCRQTFDYLMSAIKEETMKDDQLLAGKKTAYYYLIKKFAKVVKASCLMKDEDDKANEIDKFTEVLALNQQLVFGDATYTLNKNRQMNLRKPIALPAEDDVVKVREYTIKRISELVSDSFAVWDHFKFTELRDLTVSRLTLFNARRGGEPARLVRREWEEADTNAWLSERMQSENDVEKKLFEQMKITFQSGKGNNHLVPVLIPTDTVAAMRLLTDAEVREAAGVSRVNEYVFPSTKCSDQHISGWHAISRVCTWSKVEHPDRLTATKMRHRISTLYAALDVSESDRLLFYKHMGHSGSINANIYQTPLAEAEVLRVGSQLQKMDGGAAANVSETNDRPSIIVTAEPCDEMGTSVPNEEASEASSVTTWPREKRKAKAQKRKIASESDTDSDFDADRPLQARTRGMRSSVHQAADSTVSSSDSELPISTTLDSQCPRRKQQKPQGEYSCM
jgi:hypothetical protein